jgi:hypothetical protein
MNNLYVISEGELIQLANDVEHIEGGKDLMEIDDSQSPDWEEPGGKKGVERRCHKRFHLKKDAFVLIRPISAGPLNIQGKSMGGIACEVFNARPARLGKIENISMGGLQFQHVTGKKQLNRNYILEILSADCKFYLPNIPFEIKADFVLPGDIPDSSFEIRQVRLQFQNLSASQQARLNQFLLKHGTEVGEIGVKD